MTPAVLDHLWQSTLAALAVALLTTAFRKAAAGVRYGLWFAASLKFLVPFAALAALGRFLAPTVRLPADAAPAAAFMARATQPFSQLSGAASPRSALLQVPFPESAFAQAHAAAAPAAPHVDPALILAAIWALGAVLVLTTWMVRLARVRAIVRAASPLPWPAPMKVLASSSLLEPGLVGLWRPVLLVPDSLPGHLAQAEIDAVLAHEASHLRRRDNVTAAIHMLVETLFWFHPLVWWIGARLITERERACDEAVVRAGHDRGAYARGLVECCRLYLQSPLLCVAGASGSSLKRRVELILTAPFSSPLPPAKKVLLTAVGVFALATPGAAGMLASPAGQQAAARVAALATRLAPAVAGGGRSAPPSSAALPAPEEGDAPARIMVARNEAAATPAVSVESLPPSPAQDIPAARVEAAAAPIVQAAPAAAPPSAAPVSQSVAPADPHEQAASFVRSYAASTRQRHLVARWINPICVQVVGLAPVQAAAVRERVEEVATAVGLGLKAAGCQKPDVEIGFTTDPQRMLDDVVARKADSLGDPTSDTRTVKTVTLPVQAWYLTNSVEYADNGGAADLKVRVLYPWQGDAPSQASPQQLQSWGAQMLAPSYAPDYRAPWGEDRPDDPRRFLHVMVIVDLRRTGNTPLSLLSNYVAMLALSQPRSLDRCNALPSVTDLFAGDCPGRAAPDRLTQADAAYLKALYASDRRFQGYANLGRPDPMAQNETDIGERMAKILATTKVAAR